MSWCDVKWLSRKRPIHKFANAIARICCLLVTFQRTHFNWMNAVFEIEIVIVNMQTFLFLFFSVCGLFKCVQLVSSKLFHVFFLNVSRSALSLWERERERERASEWEKLNKKKVIWFYFEMETTHILCATPSTQHTYGRVIERNAISFIESLGGNWFFETF